MFENINVMDAKEFREKGYLQELNRRFLHPLGLALEISIEEDGTESLGRIWDYRGDPEGISYDIANPQYSNEEQVEKFQKSFDFIEGEIKSRKMKRIDGVGFWVEPIPGRIKS